MACVLATKPAAKGARAESVPIGRLSRPRAVPNQHPHQASSLRLEPLPAGRLSPGVGRPQARRRCPHCRMPLQPFAEHDSGAHLHERSHGTPSGSKLGPRPTACSGTKLALRSVGSEGDNVPGEKRLEGLLHSLLAMEGDVISERRGGRPLVVRRPQIASRLHEPGFRLRDPNGVTRHRGVDPPSRLLRGVRPQGGGDSQSHRA